MNPTLAGFIAFVRGTGVPVDDLPDDSVWFVYAFNVAVELVNQTLEQVSPTVYMLAVYNLGMSNLVNFAQDTPPSTYFAVLRSKFNIFGAVLGVVQSASDEGTSSSYLVPDVMKSLSLADLQMLKDPWGRTYLALAMRLGSIWGLN